LQGLAAQIATSDLIDVIRNDAVELAVQVKTYSLEDPMAHIVIAAGDAMHQALAGISQASSLYSRAISGAGSDPNYSEELSLLERAGSNFAAVLPVAETAVQQVEALTPNSPNFQDVLKKEDDAVQNLVAGNGAMTIAIDQLQQAQDLLQGQ
jgi:hypothetical protein